MLLAREKMCLALTESSLCLTLATSFSKKIATASGCCHELAAQTTMVTCASRSRANRTKFINSSPVLSSTRRPTLKALTTLTATSLTTEHAISGGAQPQGSAKTAKPDGIDAMPELFASGRFQMNMPFNTFTAFTQQQMQQALMPATYARLQSGRTARHAVTTPSLLMQMSSNTMERSFASSKAAACLKWAE